MISMLLDSGTPEKEAFGAASHKVISPDDPLNPQP